MNENINLVLTLDEANLLLANLGKLPYEQVFALVKKIQEQGIPQAEAIVKAKEEAQSAAEATPVEAA
jgi:hypothetical protein